MVRRFTFKDTQINLPTVCFVCRQPADHSYAVNRTLIFGRNTVNLTLPMPLCSDHFAVASRKSRGEQWMERVGLVLGIILGIGVTAGLLSYWAATQQGHLALNLFLATFVGLGAFLIVWVLLALYVAPLFASPDSKTARNALRIRRYWPGNGAIQLEFANDAVAELVARDNADRLLRQE